MSVEPAQMLAITLNTKKDVTNIVKRMREDYQEVLRLKKIGEYCYCLYLDVSVGSAEMFTELQRAVDKKSFRGISYSSCYAPFPCNLRIYYDCHDYPLVYYSKNVQTSEHALLDDEKNHQRILAQEQIENETLAREIASMKKVKRLKK